MLGREIGNEYGVKHIGIDTHKLNSCPKTTPDPLLLRARSAKKLVAGCLCRSDKSARAAPGYGCGVRRRTQAAKQNRLTYDFCE